MTVYSPFLIEFYVTILTSFKCAIWRENIPAQGILFVVCKWQTTYFGFTTSEIRKSNKGFCGRALRNALYIALNDRSRMSCSVEFSLFPYKTGASTTMSDDDRDIDVESDEGDDSDSRPAASRQNSSSQYYSQAEKRAHHNALERKRRDHIKDSFSSLRESVPALSTEKVASRAQILKKAAEYIQFMKRKNNSHQQDIQDLKRQNSLLEAQIRTLEKAKATGAFGVDPTDGKDSFNETESETSDMEEAVQQRRPKKMKVGTYH